MTRKKSEQYNLGKETELIEHKKTIGEKKEAVISTCAMLNKQGRGTVYFGVKNDGTVIGHETGANTLRDVGRAITDHIKPVVYPKVETETYGDKEVIKVSFDGTRQPYLAYGKPYIRVSDEDKQMDQEMYDDLLRSRDNKSKAWESQRSKYKISDIDRAVFDAYLKQAKQVGRITFEDDDPESVLDVLELTDGEYLLNAGAALFVNSHINDLQIARFPTDEKLTFLDIRRHHGSILELVDVATKYIMAAIDWRVEFDGGRARKEIPELPPAAVREAVVNAFAHRLIEGRESVEVCVYKSTVTISSPGAFPSKLTPEMFINKRRRPVRRNPLIAQTLYYSKDMESHATGLKRIQDDCDAMGCKVEYEYDDYGFTTIFHRHCGQEWEAWEKANKEKSGIGEEGGVAKSSQNYPKEAESSQKYPKPTDSKRDIIINMIKSSPSVSRDELASATGLTVYGIKYYLNKLVKEGRIEHKGSKRGGYWIVIEDE